jgi:hypothetical protein
MEVQGQRPTTPEEGQPNFEATASISISTKTLAFGNAAGKKGCWIG